MTPIAEGLREEVTRYVSPIQVFDTQRIRANVLALGSALSDMRHVLFAVKSFPSPTVLKVARDAGAGFEVSSLSEYGLLPEDLSGATVSLNAPAPLRLPEYLERGNQLHVHLDSPDLAEGLPTPHGARLALRLNHTSLGLDANGIARPSRFGSSRRSFVESASLFRSGRLSGVHLHNGSESNGPEFYRAALNLIVTLARDNGIPLESINLGGGLHPIPDAGIERLMTDLQDEAGSTPILVEPGHVLCRGAGYLLSRVLAIREVEPGRFNITMDSCYECHAKWSPRLEWQAPAEIEAVRCRFDSIPPVQPGESVLHFTGASCSEWDIIGLYRIAQQRRSPVEVGDVLTFANLNGYAYAWNTPFNGVPEARVRFV